MNSGRIYSWLALGFLLILVWTPSGNASRGGWTDPPGGWVFVDDFGTAPLYENDPKWRHDNGSDAWSGNTNTDLFGQDVVRIDTVVGAGDTEDGVIHVADAKALTIVDFGDPRGAPTNLPDPSDRKIYLLAPVHAPGDPNLPVDPMEQGITFVTRFRVAPLAASEAINAVAPSDPITYIPERSDNAHIGVGFNDPIDDTETIMIGLGYYTEGAISILANDTVDPDGDENVPVASGIDTSQFHAVWVNAKTDPNNYFIIHVRAFIDGSTTPVTTDVLRNDADTPTPENIQNDADFNGFPELCVNLGSAGTPAVGTLQYDYVAMTYAGAFDPVAATRVNSWELY